MRDEVTSPALKAQVAVIEGTTLDGSDFIEVDAGKTPKFNAINPYKRKVDVNKVVKEYNEKVGKTGKIQEQDSERTRGAR